MSTQTAVAAAEPAPVPMSRMTRNSLGVLGGAAAVGMLGDALLRATPWGINLTLWTLALVAAAVGLRRWAGLDEAGRTWIWTSLGVAALAAWRDSPTLKALDILALLLALGLAMARTRGVRLRAAGVAAYGVGLARGVFEVVAGLPALVLEDVRWGEVSRGRGGGVALPLLRGAALALPLLALFGLLLASADAAFEGVLDRVFQLPGDVVASHLLLAGAVAWVAAGALRTLVLCDTAEEAPAPAAPRLSLGIVEVATVLGSLNVLFAVFVAVQLPRLFGSAPDGGYAQFARRGFFELVWVAGLVLPLLLGLHALLREPRHQRAFRWLAGVQVALLFVVIASALHRMRLYQGEYGLTELRLYTTAFMLWLAAVFGWFCATVLRGRRERFAFGAVVMAAEALVLLHAFDPDARIVRTNAARAVAERPFDARYAAGLSADAVPALLAALPGVASPQERCTAAMRIQRRWGPDAPRDWRTWSLSRARAHAAVRGAQAQIRAACA
jgi:hypothetical protein